ncbi:putative F-box protein At1g46984 [Silene latifolia]|uniref:putative F-box protein At1g46984 n=1 Tax=Silene latifolia TaxID=37657 RepID=UPI003D76ED40
MEMNVEQKIKGNVRRRNCNTSDASFVDIPEEIQIDILSRLTPKSLLRCRFVSKHWNDTLTIKTFLLKHSRSSDKHSKLGFVAPLNSWRKGSVISFDLNDDNTPKTTEFRIRANDVYFTDDFPMNNYYMSNICNDLICLFNPYSMRSGLINLKTRDFTHLPTITMKSEELFKSWYVLGFDPVHKVFKVLSIIYGSTTKAAILTVGSKYWNPIDYKYLPSSLIKKSPPLWITINSICLDGVIYWVPNYAIDNLIVLTVVAFDLNREVFKEYEHVTTPMSDKLFRFYLTSLKERPTLFIWKIKSDDTQEVEQWTLFNHKNPNAAWKMRNITSHNFPIMVPQSLDEISQKAVAGGSTLLQFSIWINSECSWYLWYDLEKFALE